jgi:hypothetical protein
MELRRPKTPSVTESEVGDGIESLRYGRCKCRLYEPLCTFIAQKAGDPSRFEVEGQIKR